MNYEFLRLERHDPIGIITLNRPDKLNAVNAQLAREVHAALDELGEAFPDVRVVILTGEGRGFCSGADVDSMAQSMTADGSTAQTNRDPISQRLDSIVSLAPHIRRIPQPVIAAVNGVAAGGGLGMALASDIRIASESARFSAIFIKRSLVPDTATSYTIASIAGQGVASEMGLTGGVYDAPWAYQAGLVNYIVAPDQVMEKAHELANEIAANPPLAVKAAKQLLYSYGNDLERVLDAESLAVEPISGSDDRKEAVLAFVERRPPIFKGS